MTKLIAIHTTQTLEKASEKQRTYKTSDIIIYNVLKENYHQSPIVIEVGDSKEGWTIALRLLLTLYTYTFPFTAYGCWLRSYSHN